MTNTLDVQLLSPEGLADALGVPLPTIYWWNCVGKGPKRIRIGRSVRYRLSDVDAWLDEHVVDDRTAC